MTDLHDDDMHVKMKLATSEEICMFLPGRPQSTHVSPPFAASMPKKMLRQFDCAQVTPE